jgi:hypothetical protein
LNLTEAINGTSGFNRFYAGRREHVQFDINSDTFELPVRGNERNGGRPTRFIREIMPPSIFALSRISIRQPVRDNFPIVRTKLKHEALQQFVLLGRESESPNVRAAHGGKHATI